MCEIKCLIICPGVWISQCTCARSGIPAASLRPRPTWDVEPSQTGSSCVVTEHGGEWAEEGACPVNDHSVQRCHKPCCVSCVSGWGRSRAESGDAHCPYDGGNADEAAAADGGRPAVAGAGGEFLGTDTLTEVYLWYLSLSYTWLFRAVKLKSEF